MDGRNLPMTLYSSDTWYEVRNDAQSRQHCDPERPNYIALPDYHRRVEGHETEEPHDQPRKPFRSPAIRAVIQPKPSHVGSPNDGKQVRNENARTEAGLPFDVGERRRVRPA